MDTALLFKNLSYLCPQNWLKMWINHMIVIIIIICYWLSLVINPLDFRQINPCLTTFCNAYRWKCLFTSQVCVLFSPFNFLILPKITNCYGWYSSIKTHLFTGKKRYSSWSLPMPKRSPGRIIGLHRIFCCIVFRCDES